MCSASLTWAEDAAVINPPVRLDTQQELDNLRAANPSHYARAKRLIAAANTLCPPGQPRLQSTELKSTELNSRQLSCGQMFLTSNPPKREISFTLDGIRYAALVRVTADPPKPERVQQAGQQH
jgi:hypothetical protein